MATIGNGLGQGMVRNFLIAFGATLALSSASAQSQSNDFDTNPLITPARGADLERALKLVVSVSSQPVSATLDCSAGGASEDAVRVLFPCGDIDLIQTQDEALAVASVLWGAEISRRLQEDDGDRSVAELLVAAAVVFAGETLDDAGRPDLEQPTDTRYKQRIYDFDWQRRKPNHEVDELTALAMHLMKRTATCSGALTLVLDRMQSEGEHGAVEWAAAVKRRLGSSIYVPDNSCV